MRDESNIFVYYLSVSNWQKREKDCLKILSSEEKKRAARFASTEDKDRFIFGKAVIRMLIAQELGITPQEPDFIYNEKGKPELRERQELEFNLSHSGDLIFIALRARHPVGIDVEKKRTNIAHSDLAQRFFSSYENAYLTQIQEDKRLDMFFRFWTRKEAYLKACGQGISLPLREVDISSKPARNGKIQMRLISQPQDKINWHLKDLDAPEGYFASLSSAGSRWSVKQKELIPEMFNTKTSCLELN